MFRKKASCSWPFAGMNNGMRVQDGKERARFFALLRRTRAGPSFSSVLKFRVYFTWATFKCFQKLGMRNECVKIRRWDMIKWISGRELNATLVQHLNRRWGNDESAEQKLCLNTHKFTRSHIFHVSWALLFHPPPSPKGSLVTLVWVYLQNKIWTHFFLHPYDCLKWNFTI